MTCGRFTEDDIIGVLNEREAGAKRADLACKLGVSGWSAPVESEHSRLESSGD